MVKKAIWMIFVICVGMLGPIQAGMNATLKRELKSVALAGSWNMILALIFFIIFAIVTKAPIPTLTVLYNIPWWAFLGGACGFFYIFASILSVSKLGAILLIICFASGNMFASVIIDHFGLIGYQIRPITLTKFMGILLVIVGIYLAQK